MTIALLGVMAEQSEAQYPEPAWDWFGMVQVQGNWDRHDPLNVMVYSSYSNTNNYGAWTSVAPRLVSIGWGITAANSIYTYDHNWNWRSQDSAYAKGGIACTTPRCRPKLRVWQLHDGLWSHSMYAVADTHCCNLSPPAHIVDNFNGSQSNLAADVVNTRPSGSSYSWWSVQKAAPGCLGNGNIPTFHPSAPCSSYQNVGYAAPVHWDGRVEIVTLS